MAAEIPPEPSGTAAPGRGRPQTLWQTIGSVAAAFFGVQSGRNRERDFTQGRASHFIVVGLVMTVLVILTVVLVVKMVLRNAGM